MNREDKELEIRRRSKTLQKGLEEPFLLLEADAVPSTKSSGSLGDGVRGRMKPHFNTGGCRPETTQ